MCRLTLNYSMVLIKFIYFKGKLTEKDSSVRVRAREGERGRVSILLFTGSLCTWTRLKLAGVSYVSHMSTGVQVLRQSSMLSQVY